MERWPPPQRSLVMKKRFWLSQFTSPHWRRMPATCNDCESKDTFGSTAPAVFCQFWLVYGMSLPLGVAPAVSFTIFRRERSGTELLFRLFAATAAWGDTDCPRFGRRGSLRAVGFLSWKSHNFPCAPSEKFSYGS